MLETLGTAWGLALAVIGFGAIIFIHEMGHFLAARWAGIRVYAFAVGFGPAALAWRKGIGLRRGSTNPETLKRLRAHRDGAVESLDVPEGQWPEGLGKTEYRLNWLPFGGYVQMRGQDDVSPGAAASARGDGDSFVDKPVWKRMIVISAGVVMNVLLAVVLYIAVYLAGKPAAPAIVGGVAEGSPAAVAVAENAGTLGIERPGLLVGDEIVEIAGASPREFADVWLVGALADPDEEIGVVVRREGLGEPLRFRMGTERSAGQDFAGIGVSPARSTRLAEAAGDGASAATLAHLRAEAGLPEGAAGLRSVGGEGARVLPDVSAVFAERGASRLPAVVDLEGGGTEAVTLRGRAALESETLDLGGRPVVVEHVAGFVPPMVVGPVDRAFGQGLLPGDVIARAGRVAWPGPVEGIRAIREAAGGTIELELVRGGERVTLTAEVGPEGTIGFYPMQAREGCVVTRALPARVESGRAGREAGLPAGSVIETVNGAAVADYGELRAALAGAGAGSAIELGARLPIGGETTATVTLSEAEVERLRGLGWEAPAFFGALFEPAMTTVRAGGPVEAVVMGVSDTNQMILRTYLTLVRLVEGSVEVDQLRGPVGIAHIGTQVAQRSFVELLFFFAVISANLAVLNFLPIPIADGGLMVFLLIEWVTGKPVSPAVQNGAALVGLALLGSVFLLVTFNDITRLL